MFVLPPFERTGFRLYYRLVTLAYAVGIPTPKRTVAGTYWSYEPTNPHGEDPGLAALDDLSDDATVLDVGAHVGEYTLPLAVDTTRYVVAVEPNPVSAERLRRNARRNDLLDRVEIRRLGAGETNGTRAFYRSSFSKCSAFDRGTATRWGARITAVDDVAIRRLDDLVGDVADGDAERREGARSVPPPEGVKIDVEGHELAVLRGAVETVETHRPLLVLEVHGESDETNGDATALRDWLTAREYDVTVHDDAWICRP